MIAGAFVLPLVFLAGYASQRGRTCAVSAAFEIAKRKRARRFAGYLFAAACSLVVLSLVSLFDPALFQGFSAVRPTVLTAIGGVVFGLGAYVNGRCSLGTVARLGSGDISRLGTLAGMFAGVAIGTAFLPLAGAVGGAPQFASLAPLARILVAVAMALLFAALLRRFIPPTPSTTHWSIPRAMLVIGIVNGLLVWLARDWSYTSLFRQIARDGVGSGFGLAALAALLAGAIVAGLVNGQFLWRTGGPRDWALAGLGGMLMGLGLMLVPGGNDTMLLVGLPLLLPNLLAGYLVMYLTLVALAWATPDRQ